VSRTIVHTAPVPVLVVKSQPEGEGEAAGVTAGTPRRFRALVAHDDQQSAEKMASLLWRFTWPASAEGWVVTVVRPMFLADLPDWVRIERRDPDVAAMAAAWEQEYQQNLQSARRELEQFRATLPSCFAEQEVLVVEGRPAEQIVCQLLAKGIDLAIVGSRGRGRVERLLVGSTAEQVLASAPCSVLIVR
jgi:nucleotide-binding universal stress UspA family protein